MPLVLCAAMSSPARADLWDDASELEARLEPHYSVERLPPRFIEAQQWIQALPDDMALRFAPKPCTTVIALSTTDTRFSLRMLPSRARTPQLFPRGAATSVGGLLQVTRCGQRRVELTRMALTMVSPRAAVERLVVHSDVPLPPAYRYIKARDPGPPSPSATLHAQKSGLPIATRLDAAELAFRLDAAVGVTPLDFDVSSGGEGEISITFVPGCYRMRLMGTDSTWPTHLGAELRWPRGDGPPSFDRSETSDVELRACVVRETVGNLRFVGATPGASLVGIQARWDLPGHLRGHWGAEGAAALALALHEQQSGYLDMVPVFDALGTGKSTVLGVEVLPGTCYVAAVALLKAPTGPIAIAAQVDATGKQNVSAAEGNGTAVAFCSTASRSALLEVQSQSSEAAWLLALWQVPIAPQATEAQ